MELYAVVNYDDSSKNDNHIEIKHILENYDYANKLAFYYAKKGIQHPKFNRILKNYYHEDKSRICLKHVIVEYRICELNYYDECISDVWNNAWAVIKINNNIVMQKIEDIDETLIFKY
jgi:hypothetical protein